MFSVSMSFVGSIFLHHGHQLMGTVVDMGSINASAVLYESRWPYLFFFLFNLIESPGLLEAILFANIRFHDTVSRGRVLNRFGNDFEGSYLFLLRLPSCLTYS